MDETSALSPTSSIDCFSDAEIDIDGPPVIATYKLDETPEVSACIEKIGSKVESSIDIKISSSYKSTNEARDVEHHKRNDATEIEQSRDSCTDDVEDKAVVEPMAIENYVTDPETSDAVRPSVSAESTHANRSHFTVVSSTTMESVKTFSKHENKTKSFESANWPIDISNMSSFAKNDSIKNN